MPLGLIYQLYGPHEHINKTIIKDKPILDLTNAKTRKMYLESKIANKPQANKDLEQKFLKYSITLKHSKIKSLIQNLIQNQQH
jgi:hypothetical protein